MMDLVTINRNPIEVAQSKRGRKTFELFSTNPKVPIDGAPTVRDQVVVVHNIVQGFVEEVARLNKSSIRQGLVKWVGAGVTGAGPN